MNYKLIIVAGLIISLAACVSRKQQEVKLWGEAQGSTYSIVYIDAELRNLQDSVEQILKDIDLSMSTWIPESQISRLNRGDTITMDPYFKEVWTRSQEIHEASSGIFDVTVAPILNAWGMGHKEGLDKLNDEILSALQPLIGMENVEVSGDRMWLSMPGMMIDFNAIAQGYTVDLVAEMLERQGVFDYMVEIGGEIRTNGLNKNGKDWRIGIDKPVDQTDGRPLQIIVKLNSGSLATSGSYRKFRMKDGIRYSHAIDPRTFSPVQHSLLSVTVIGEDCMDVDAYATVFLILGVEASLDFLRDKSLEAYFISDDGLGGFKTEMTPGFQRYILEDVFE